MTIDFTKGNFVVYESKTEKGKDEVETLRYFNDYQKARRHMSMRFLDEAHQTKTVCGYKHRDVIYCEDIGDSIKDCGTIIKEITTGKNILILSLFINPAANFNPYELVI